jgi:hypothetical protein
MLAGVSKVALITRRSTRTRMPPIPLLFELNILPLTVSGLSSTHLTTFSLPREHCTQNNTGLPGLRVKSFATTLGDVSTKGMQQKREYEAERKAKTKIFRYSGKTTKCPPMSHYISCCCEVGEYFSSVGDPRFARGTQNALPR